MKDQRHNPDLRPKGLGMVDPLVYYLSRQGRNKVFARRSSHRSPFDIIANLFCFSFLGRER